MRIHKPPIQRIVKTIGITVAALFLLFVSYVCICSFVLPGEVVATTYGEPFSDETIGQLDDLFRENNLRYWLTPDKNSVIVTWGKQNTVYNLLSENGWDEYNLCRRSSWPLMGYFLITPDYMNIWLNHGPYPR